MNHLSDWQIEELIIDFLDTRGCMQCDSRAQDPARLHLENCPLCSAKKRSLEESLLLYREAALINVEDAIRRAGASNHSIAAEEAQSLSSHQPFWGWPARAFAFLLLLVVLIPAFVLRERGRHEARQAARNRHVQMQEQEQAQAKDDLLLQQVDQEITESVPRPMQSLSQPVLDDGSRDE